ncbi:hypothetical protein F3Y22_tig00117012pilonHSYRG00252 [Hibiscus syriacus]|uniref:Uncharacterized protein n=1 Tax=Hibiscus syriacus TaxID=106335 RepID=A0A6A2WDJ7_HIBSY|nr:hypothetical protein F3Y22_tig00117012pilonHSYRG00252 [Hibiscus syriacus]
MNCCSICRILGNKGGAGHLSFIDDLSKLFNSLEVPKIRELMQVDGLTNDEVKSHLQLGKEVKISAIRKQTFQSVSPQCPLFANERAKGLSSTTGGDSMDTEEEENSDGRI